MTIQELETKIKELDQEILKENLVYIIVTKGELFGSKETHLAYTSFHQCLVRAREMKCLDPRIFCFRELHEVKQ